LTKRIEDLGTDFCEGQFHCRTMKPLDLSNKKKIGKIEKKKRDKNNFYCKR